MNSKQQLRAGDQSVNVQIDTVHTGLTYTDVRNMVIDLFKENFPKLREEAATIAMERAEEITDRFLGRLAEVHPEAISNARDPDMQMALLQVQREYARTGDKELGELLVDMLVDRTSQAGRSMRQLVLNEALNAAPRLTVAGIDILSIIWLVRNVRHGARNLQELHDALRRNLAPFAGVQASFTELRHLEYAGCVSLGIEQNDIIETTRLMYLGIFTNGFSKYDPDIKGLPIDVLTPCLRNPKRRVQLNMLNQQMLDELVTQFGLEDHKQRLRTLLNKGAMTLPEVEQELLEAIPELRKIVDVWRSSLMKHADLTSVGTAIGHANWRRVTGGTQDIETWLV